MKIYYSLDTNQILTEEEARKYVKEEISDNDYSIWEFISNNYCYDEIMDNLPQDFLENAKEENSDDDDTVWEFDLDNCCYDEVIENLSQSFLENVTEKLIKNRLENPDYFLVREFPN